MLQLRPPQVEAFREEAGRRLDAEIAEGLAEFFPIHAQRLQPEGLRVLVGSARHRAAELGATDGRSIRRYATLAVLLGVGFARDPQYPWAAALLADTSETAFTRLRRVHVRAVEFLRETAGDDHRKYQEALGRLQRLSHEELTAATGREGPLLARIDPSRNAALDDDARSALLCRVGGELTRQRLASCPGSPLLAVMMFLMGHEVLEDPQYPWAASALHRHAGDSEEERTHGLLAAARAELDEVLGMLPTERRA